LTAAQTAMTATMKRRLLDIRPRTPRSASFRHGAAGLLLAAMMHTPAPAQQVTVIVNGEPITSYDIDQRAKFIQLSTHKPPPRQDVVEDLINDKLKVQAAKRYKLDITDNDVNTAFANMAKRMRVNAETLTQMLAQNGVNAGTLKSRIRSEIAWTQIVRGKFASSLQMTDKEVRDAIQQGVTSKDPKEDGKDLVQGSVDNKDDSAKTKGVEFIMRPILFIVPRGASGSAVEDRKHEAESLRARFANCDTDLAYARTLRAVVRDQVTRTSADLAPDLRKILETTPVGHLTPPDVTDQGVQVFAVCTKREIAGDTPEERQVRDKLFAQKFDEQSKRYLAELRRGAMIEVK